MLGEFICWSDYVLIFIQIQEAETTKEANFAIEEAADILSIMGCLRHVSKLEEKDSLVHAAIDFIVNGRMRNAHDQ